MARIMIVDSGSGMFRMTNRRNGAISGMFEVRV